VTDQDASIVVAANPWPCQVVRQAWSEDVVDPRGQHIGGGWVFTYCPHQQRFAVSWIPTRAAARRVDRGDPRRHQRSLRVCELHALEFAAQHARAMPAVPTSTANDDPFGDSDQPYDRVRESA
jgi:hypothetical protein